MLSNVNFVTVRRDTRDINDALHRYTRHLISNCLKLQYPFHETLFATHFLCADGSRFMLERLSVDSLQTRLSNWRRPLQRGEAE